MDISDELFEAALDNIRFKPETGGRSYFDIWLTRVTGPHTQYHHCTDTVSRLMDRPSL